MLFGTAKARIRKSSRRMINAGILYCLPNVFNKKALFNLKSSYLLPWRVSSRAIAVSLIAIPVREDTYRNKSSRRNKRDRD